MKIKTLAAAAVLAAAGFGLSGCLAAMATGAVVGTAVGVTATTVKVAAKGTGMVVGAVIPGGDKKKKD
jgi:hypothetical protein